jgi:hypothetical protein
MGDEYLVAGAIEVVRCIEVDHANFDFDEFSFALTLLELYEKNLIWLRDRAEIGFPFLDDLDDFCSQGRRFGSRFLLLCLNFGWNHQTARDNDYQQCDTPVQEVASPVPRIDAECV